MKHLVTSLKNPKDSFRFYRGKCLQPIGHSGRLLWTHTVRPCCGCVFQWLYASNWLSFRSDTEAIRLDKLKNVCSEITGLWLIFSRRRTCTGHVRRSTTNLASLEKTLRSLLAVRFRFHNLSRLSSKFCREESRRVLSLASDPQPEPPATTFHQLAKVDSGFLAWRFPIYDGYGREIGLIDRAFRGLGREVGHIFLVLHFRSLTCCLL